MGKSRRVGAILSSDPETRTTTVLGFGVYVGDEIRPAHLPMPLVGKFLEEVADILYGPCSETPDPEQWEEYVRDVGGLTNPKIVLDNGHTVWGCMCWWGDEGVVNAQLSEQRESGFNVHIMSSEEIDEMEEPLRRRRRDFVSKRTAEGLRVHTRTTIPVG